MYIYIYIYMSCTSACTYLHTTIPEQICTYIPPCLHTCTHVWMPTHTHTHTHTHITRNESQTLPNTCASQGQPRPAKASQGQPRPAKASQGQPRQQGSSSLALTGAGWHRSATASLSTRNFHCLGPAPGQALRLMGWISRKGGGTQKLSPWKILIG